MDCNEQNLMLCNYAVYLEFLNEKLKKFFESQKPYIFCRKGCAKCCKNSQFPYSAIEFRYLLNGALTLDKRIQEKIEANIKELLVSINNVEPLAHALSWFIQGNDSLFEELSNGTLDEVIDGLESAYSLLSTKNFLRLSVLAKNVASLTAKQRQ